MNSILIVDDDVIIREGLVTDIPWDKNGIKVVGSASDGERALELIEKEKPRIILTDIKMPFMDGIQLADIVSKKYPDIKFIFLTGYDEFEYAKAAINLKIEEYLLKPIDKKTLLEVVKRVFWIYENEQRAKHQLTESRPLLLQRFLYNIIHEQLNGEEIKHNAEFLDISFDSNYFSCLVIKMDDFPPSLNTTDVFHQVSLKLGIVHILEDSLNELEQKEKIKCLYTDTGRDEITVLLVHPQNESSNFYSQFFKLTDPFKKKIKTMLNLSLTIGVGMPYRNLKQVAISYRQACMAADLRYLMGNNQVFFFKDIETQPKNDLLNIDLMNWELIDQIKIGLEDEAFKAIKFAQKEFISKGCTSISYIRFFAMEKLMLLYREFEEYLPDEPRDNGEPIYVSLFQEIQTLNTIDEIFQCISTLTHEICIQVKLRRKTHQQKSVEKAMHIMGQQYHDPALRLNSVSEEVGICPSYLSLLFKQLKDINFSDYLLQLRITRAIELLQSTDLLVYEIAEKTGYSNSQYFSLCFKKYSGYSPSQFKQKNQGKV